jgi:hypothetical protein
VKNKRETPTWKTQAKMGAAGQVRVSCRREKEYRRKLRRSSGKIETIVCLKKSLPYIGSELYPQLKD